MKKNHFSVVIIRSSEEAGPSLADKLLSAPRKQLLDCSKHHHLIIEVKFRRVTKILENLSNENNLKPLWCPPTTLQDYSKHYHHSSSLLQIYAEMACESCASKFSLFKRKVSFQRSAILFSARFFHIFSRIMSSYCCFIF